MSWGGILLKRLNSATTQGARYIRETDVYRLVRSVSSSVFWGGRKEESDLWKSCCEASRGIDSIFHRNAMHGTFLTPSGWLVLSEWSTSISVEERWRRCCLARPLGPRLADASRQTNYPLEKILPTIYRWELLGHSSLKDRECDLDAGFYRIPVPRFVAYSILVIFVTAR